MKSIQFKITVYVGSSLFFLFVILLFTIDREMEKTAIPLSENLTDQIVSARGDQISYWIEQRIGDLEMIAHNVSYFNMSHDEALKYMASIYEKKDNIYESFGIVNDEGEVWLTNGTKFSIHNREYYEKLSEGGMEYVISDPINSRSNKADIIVIMYRFKKTNQDKYQYISAAVPIAKIRQIASDIHLHDGIGRIVDNTGCYIDDNFYEDRETRNKQIKFQAPIHKAPGWNLTFQVTESKLKEGTRKLQHSAILVGCIVGVALITLLIVFGSSIVKPIRNLQKLMRKVEIGDLSVRFKEDRTDEIGQLGKSFNQMLNNLNKAQYEKRQMEFRLVQEQIKPHFLYNTLDTIQWMATDYEADEVVELIEALSTYFRIGLSKGNRFITLGEELNHIESYLQIQKARYEELLQYEIKYDETLINHHVIRVLLQPLVENAICHGIQNDKKCLITIEIFSSENDMFMEVKDNGVGFDYDKLVKIQNCLNNNYKDSEEQGFGLYSVNHRLKLAFGEKYGLTINCSNGWTTAVIKCRLIEGSGEYVESINSR